MREGYEEPAIDLDIYLFIFILLLEFSVVIPDE